MPIRTAWPMMLLGRYIFMLRTAVPQSTQQTDSYRWAGLDRFGRDPAQQFTGWGATRLRLEGTILPHFRGGLIQINLMRGEADRAEPLTMTDGLGFNRGRWVIEEITETRRLMFADGAPRQVDFTLSLLRYGEDAA